MNSAASKSAQAQASAAAAAAPCAPRPPGRPRSSEKESSPPQRARFWQILSPRWYFVFLLFSIWSVISCPLTLTPLHYRQRRVGGSVCSTDSQIIRDTFDQIHSCTYKRRGSHSKRSLKCSSVTGGQWPAGRGGG